MAVKLTIIYPSDPFGLKVGGAEAFLNGVIKNAPDDFEIDYLGVSTNNADRIAVGARVERRMGNKKFYFSPVLFEKDENKKTLIPLSLRFSLALKFLRVSLKNRVIFFNRIEPAILFGKDKSPKIVVIHNDIKKQIEGKGSEVLWNKFPKAYFLLERHIFKYLDYIYTVSKSSLDFYCSSYSQHKEKFSFLPTWVDTDIFLPVYLPKGKIKEQLNSVNNFLPINKKWILYVGRFQEQKAPLRVVDSFLEYYKKDKESCLVMIGEGNLKREVENYIKKNNLENNVFLFGNMKQEILKDYYTASDVLLLASNFEGMPMCVLEALGSGLPVVTTNVGEVKRAVINGVSGEIVERLLPEDIGKALDKVLNCPGRYTQKNCVDSIFAYTPQKALTPVYDKIRALYSGMYLR